MYHAGTGEVPSNALTSLTYQAAAQRSYSAVDRPAVALAPVHAYKGLLIIERLARPVHPAAVHAAVASAPVA